MRTALCGHIEGRDQMHYAAEYLTAERHRAVIRAAHYLLARAEDVLEGR